MGTCAFSVGKSGNKVFIGTLVPVIEILIEKSFKFAIAAH